MLWNFHPLAATSFQNRRKNNSKRNSPKWPLRSMPVPATLARDVQFLWQSLRIALVGFDDALNAVYDILARDRNLKEFSSQAIPIILQVCSAVTGDAWATPRLSHVTNVWLTNSHHILICSFAKNTQSHTYIYTYYICFDFFLFQYSFNSFIGDLCNELYKSIWYHIYLLVL